MPPKRKSLGYFNLQNTDQNVGSLISKQDVCLIFRVNANDLINLTFTKVNGIQYINEVALAKAFYNKKIKNAPPSRIGRNIISFDEYLLKAVILQTFPNAKVTQQVKWRNKYIDLKVEIPNKIFFIEFHGPGHFIHTYKNPPTNPLNRKSEIEKDLKIPCYIWPYWVHKCSENLKILMGQSKNKGIGAIWGAKEHFADFYFTNSNEIIQIINSQFNIDNQNIGQFYEIGVNGINKPEHPIIERIKKQPSKSYFEKLIPKGTRKNEISDWLPNSVVSIANEYFSFNISYNAYQVTGGSLDEIIPEVSVSSNNGKTYTVKCYDKDSGQLVCAGQANKTKKYQGTRQWFTNWHIKIYDKRKLIREDVFNPKGKIISIRLQSALGDTIAWFPYIEEFRQKQDCTIIVSCKHASLFKNQYPEILFIEEGEVKNTYASYLLGIAWDSNPVVLPNSIEKLPLQKISSDILGLDYIERRPRLAIPDSPRPIEEKYVCVTEYVSGKLNNWTKKNGYQDIVYYLNNQGYKVVVISLEPTTLNNVINKTGCSLQEAMVYLKYAEFFVGGSTGLAWLSWAVGCYVFMINSYTPPFHEFQENCTHIWNKEYPIEKLCTTNDEVKMVQEHPVSAEVVIKEIESYIKK